MNYEIRICPRCAGIGKLKAMQMGINHKGKTQRVQDTVVKCRHCEGTGLILGDKRAEGME